MYSQPLCKEGEKIVSGGYAANGCALPGKCVPVSVAPSITVLSPNGGETFVQGSSNKISWESKNLPSNTTYVHLYLSPYVDVGGTTGLIEGAITCSGAVFYPTSVYYWDGKTICSGAQKFEIKPGNYKIVARLYSWPNTLNPGIEIASDTSDAAFSIVEPPITVLSPNGGEKFNEGQDISITWTSKGVNNVYIHAYYYDENNNIGDPGSSEEFSFNSGECRLTYEPVPASTGKYVVKNGGSGRCGKMPAGNKIKIQISEQATDIKDLSDNYFSIVAEENIKSFIKVLSPNGGETLRKGQLYEVKWTGGYSTITDPTRSVALMLVKEDGTTQVGWIQFGNQPSGSYSWDPAKVRSAIGYPYNVDVPVGKYKIRVIDYNDPKGRAVAYDVSDAAFSIVAASSGVGQYYSTGQTANVLESMKIILDQIQEAINKLKN